MPRVRCSPTSRSRIAAARYAYCEAARQPGTAASFSSATAAMAAADVSSGPARRAFEPVRGAAGDFGTVQGVGHRQEQPGAAPAPAGRWLLVRPPARPRVELPGRYGASARCEAQVEVPVEVGGGGPFAFRAPGG